MGTETEYFFQNDSMGKTPSRLVPNLSDSLNEVYYVHHSPSEYENCGNEGPDISGKTESLTRDQTHSPLFLSIRDSSSPKDI